MKLENLRIVPLEESRFVTPKRLLYTQNGQEKVWDMVDVHDSVAVLLVDRQADEFLVVRQLRPAVYTKNGEGFTYELCAGILDKEVSSLRTAKEEILEECGYDIPEGKIQRITSFYTSVGYAAGMQELFFAWTDDGEQIHGGGGVEDEVIEVVRIPVREGRAFILDESKPKTPGIMYAFMWYFENHGG